MTDIVELKRMLAAQAQAVAEHLLPAGQQESHEWRIGSVAGEPGRSLGVHLDGQKAGVWSDFSTGQSGDLIDLWMTVCSVDLPTALGEIRSWLGVERPRLCQAKTKQWKRPARPACATPERRALDYLREDRNLPMDVLMAYKVGEDDRQAIIFPFDQPDGTLAMAKRRDSVDGAKPVPIESGCEPILFGWQAIPANSRIVVITEGEIDALSMAAYGYPALSVPYGGGGGDKQKWIENEYDRLDRFERARSPFPGAHDAATAQFLLDTFLMSDPTRRDIEFSVPADQAEALLGVFAQVWIQAPGEGALRRVTTRWGVEGHVRERAPRSLLEIY